MAVSAAARALFAVGLFLFLAGYGHIFFADPAFFVLGGMIWVFLFGLPAYLCYRFRLRAGVTAVAALFFLATAVNVVSRVYESHVLQPRIESLRADGSLELRPAAGLRGQERSGTTTAVSAGGPLPGTGASERAAIAKEYARRADDFVDRGDYEAAIRNYVEAIRLDPKNAEYRFRCGYARCQQGNALYAIRDYDEAISLKPRHASWYFQRGLAWTLLKEHDKARRDFDEAHRLDPANYK